MGRNRKKNRHMPANMRESHNAYYLTRYEPMPGSEDRRQRWVFLSRDYGEALEKYRQTCGFVAPTGRLVSDLIDRYEEEGMEKLRPTSRRSYRSWLPMIRKTWGHMPVADVRQPHAAVFLDRYPEKITANRVVTLFTTLLKLAVRWGWIDRNPLEGIAKHPEPRRTRTIRDDEWQALLAAAFPAFRLMMRVARFTALRRSDLCRLTWGCIKADRLVVVTHKTMAPVSFKIEGELKVVIDELRSGITPFPTRALFRVKGGGPLTDSLLGQYFGKVKEKSGVTGVTFHDIRRTRLTELAERYGIEFAKRVAAHASAQTTQRYYHAPEAVKIDWPAEEISPIRGARDLRGGGA